MHEMSLAMGVMQIVDDAARGQGSAGGTPKVRGVRLEIGRLASVEVEALRFCFEVVTRGTIADGATLTIDSAPGSAWCMRCGHPVQVAGVGEPCPDCGGYQLQITGGTEMRVKDIEVD